MFCPTNMSPVSDKWLWTVSPDQSCSAGISSLSGVRHVLFYTDITECCDNQSALIFCKLICNLIVLHVETYNLQ